MYQEKGGEDVSEYIYTSSRRVRFWMAPIPRVGWSCQGAYSAQSTLRSFPDSRKGSVAITCSEASSDVPRRIV